MTLATLELARERGLTVPTDLSLISFDDTPIIRLAHPPLTAIVQPIAEVTAQAVTLIIADHGNGPTTATPVMVPARMTVRESTASIFGGKGNT